MFGNKPKLYAVFFGNINEKTKRTAIQTLVDNGIGVYEFIYKIDDTCDINIINEPVEEMDIS